jgi:chloramphenicol O-acetyltransferase type A
MPGYLDIESWPRRHLFHFFKGYEDPFFNVCADVDITPLLEFAHAQNLSFFVTSHFLSIKTANEVEAFRYRLRGDRVLVHERIHAGATLLLADESFTFIYFDYTENFEDFHSNAKATIENARVEVPSLYARADRDDLIYHSVIPWVSFNSISHARDLKRQNSVPKVTFGKYRREGDRIKMPVSVEAHHALMDGLHVGRYFERLASYFFSPRSALEL